MEEKMVILYVHGMGGGEDSRIPALLQEALDEVAPGRTRVVVRTYDFHPDKAAPAIAGWMEELRPRLVIGESLGAIHALALKGVPHLLVSPSLNAPIWLGLAAPLALIPGVSVLFDWIWKPRSGRRQTLHFSWKNLHRWPSYRRKALANSPAKGGRDAFFAFFGRHDHYRRSGVVRIGTWRKYYGAQSFTVYEGTHFMEEEYVRTLLRDAVLKYLDDAQD